MFNHPCEPNVAGKQIRDGGNMALYATKMIKRGEECYLDYLNVADQPIAERQRQVEGYIGGACRGPKGVREEKWTGE